MRIGRWIGPLSVFVIGAAAAVSAAPAGDAGARAVLALLHDGRFDEAERAAAGAAAADPTSPEAAFLEAFVPWWRLIYDDENPALVGRLEERLVRAAKVGEAGVSSRREGAAIWGGYSHLLLAQIRIAQKKTLDGAREARRGHRLLTEAARAAPGSAEADFGLGTYHYYAARVSALAKGLRFLFGLPAGDRDRGLAELDRAARRGALLGLEARLLRATIFAGRHERRYPDALAEHEGALGMAPDAITVLDSAARLDLSVDRPERSAARLERALERAAEAPGTSPSVVAALRYQLARCDFVRFRPDRALERLEALLAVPVLPARIRREAEQLAASCRGLMARGGGVPGAEPRAVPWKRIADALDAEAAGGPEGSLALLRVVAREFPADPVAALFLGRALVRSERGAEALEPLLSADRSHALPPAWVGPCRLLAGRAADLAGRRARAKELYREATKAPPFIASGAPYYHDQVAYRSDR